MKMNFQQYINYIDDDRAIGWLTSSYTRGRGVFIHREYMTLCNGNAFDAMILAQIIYYSELNDNMQPRLTHWYKKHLWIVKSYEEWGEELGINARTVRNILDRLKEKDIIIKEVHKSPYHIGKNGVPKTISFVRLNWKNFIDLVQNLLREKSISSQDENSGTTSNVDPGVTSNVNPDGKTSNVDLEEKTSNVDSIPEINIDSHILISPSASFAEDNNNGRDSGHPARELELIDEDAHEGKDEPQYVEAGEEFGDSPTGRKIPRWKQSTSDLCTRALTACGRLYFKSRDERSRWIKIEKAMLPLDPEGRIKYPTEWVTAKIEWAENRNRVRLGSGGVTITFPSLLSAIENEEYKTDWIAKMLNNPTLLSSEETHEEWAKRLKREIEEA